MAELLAKIPVEIWGVLEQMAPYLLFGFLVAGILSVCVRPSWVERHLGRGGLGPVLTASLVGVPLPLCSCGVLPVAASIRRHGASRAATTAFLLSTPQTGVDSIAVTYALLGPVFAIFRPLAALVSGLVGGFFVQLFDQDEPVDGELSDEELSDESTCCQDACCESRSAQDATCNTQKLERKDLVRQSLVYGFVTLPRDIGVPLVLGILIAGLMAALIPQDLLTPYLGGGIVAILILMALGVPVYVCATASVPIAAGFMHAGASPGAALAFLIAGPATNAAALTTIWKVLGPRTMLVYGVTVGASAIGFGLLLDAILPVVTAALPQLEAGAHAHVESGWLGTISAVVLLAVVGFSFWITSRPAENAENAENAKDRSEDETSGPSQPSEEQQVEFAIKGMRCSHCAGSIQRALAECPGVREAKVDFGRARAVVRGRDLDCEKLAATVVALGYAVEEIDPCTDR